jgi:hypothetical protein
MDPSESRQPFRYEFQFAIERFIRKMESEKRENDTEVKEGALDLLAFMYCYLYQHFFKDHEDIQVRDIIYAIEDAHSNAWQELGASEYELETMTPIDTDHELKENHPQ